VPSLGRGVRPAAFALPLSWPVLARSRASPLAEGAGLAPGTLGACPQAGADLGQLGGGLRAEAGQHLLRVGACPLKLGAASFPGCLCPGGLLLRQPGGFSRLRRVLT
jgi:hypothetical protein